MHHVLRSLLLLVLVMAASPAQAQNRTPPPPGPGPGIGPVVPFIVQGIGRQIIEDSQRRQAADPAPSTQGTPTRTPPANTSPPPQRRVATPVFRDIPLPRIRPATSFSRPTFVPDAERGPDTLVIAVAAGEREGALAALALAFGLTLLEDRELSLRPLHIALFRLAPGADLDETVAALQQDGRVISVQPSYVHRPAQADASSGADLRRLQYAPARLNVAAARAAGEGEGVRIGLIDTGVDAAQPVFENASLKTFDIMDGTAVADRDHGTAMAGLMIASARLDGIAPRAQVYSVRAFDSDAEGDTTSSSFYLSGAIDWMVDEGAQVLNLSFAGPRDPIVLEMLDAAAERGVLLVAAAGNDGPDAAPAYPGAHRFSIAVTATDDRDRLFSGANRGEHVAIAAPGVDVLSPLPGGRFELLSGTSVATAHMTGVVALMLARDPQIDRQQVLEALRQSARDLGPAGHDTGFGAGLADAKGALEAIGALQ